MLIEATVDYDLGHFEAYGVDRVFHDRLSQIGAAQSQPTVGSGVAAGLIHIVSKPLNMQFSGLAGTGIGRYGTS